MDPRWRTLQEIFAAARELADDERARYLERRCAGDAGLLEEVRSLLAADAAEGILDGTGPGLGPLRNLLAEPAPERAGPYVVSDEIGRGGMGVVYRAHDPRLRRDVALKFLTGWLHRDPRVRSRFITEAQAASALDHPHLCTIHDIGTAEDGRLFIAMAYYGRGTLAQRLAEGPLPVAEAVEIALQVASALECAHEAGIVHRDIKPANIVFGERGEAKVLDFGVALLAAEARDASRPTAGTPGYMAPEQLRGDAVDRRADVWALGVVLYEMLSGRHPFEAADRAAVRDAILHAEPEPLATLQPDLPPALVRVVAKALAKTPAERFSTAGELAAALREAAPARATALARRRRIRYAAVLALALALAAAALVDRLNGPRGRRNGLAGAPTDSGAYGLFLRGQERLRAGTGADVEAAIVLFRSALDRDPDHAPAHALLARSLARATLPGSTRHGQDEWLDSAAVHARRAIALAPDRPDGYSALGVIHRARGRLDDALEQHRRAIELDPRHARSIFEIGRIQVALHRYDEAVLWLERGLAIEPATPLFRRYAVRRYRGLGLFDHARRHIEAGLRRAPDDAALRWEAVLVAFETGDPEAAARHFESFIALQPASEHNRLRAWFAFFAGDMTAARRYAERAGFADAAWFDLQMYGLVFRRLGDVERGNALLRRAISIMEAETGEPGWSEGGPELLLARLYAALGERERAVRALETWRQGGGIHLWRAADYGPNVHWAGAAAPAWDAVRDDPRFRRIVARNTARLDTMRARVRAELDRLPLHDG